MNQIRLEWTHFPDSQLIAVEARGIDAAEVQDYARKVGFISYLDDESYSLLIATRDKREELTALLESAGYEVENAEVV